MSYGVNTLRVTEPCHCVSGKKQTMCCQLEIMHNDENLNFQTLSSEQGHICSGAHNEKECPI